jgi:hypothetical protein
MSTAGFFNHFEDATAFFNKNDEALMVLRGSNGQYTREACFCMNG